MKYSYNYSIIELKPDSNTSGKYAFKHDLKYADFYNETL